MAKKTASKSTKPKPFCFVLMPFASAFNDVYQLGIKPACDDAGAYCERVDEQIFAERMLDRIYNQIDKADIIVADMTGQNPNVFYEVGYAHALGRTVVLVTQKGEDIPFDLRHHFHIVYGDGGDKISRLRADLSKRVKWFIDNPTDSKPKAFTEVDIRVNGTNILLDGSVELQRNAPNVLSIELDNRSFDALVPETYSVTLVLPDNYYLHMSKERPPPGVSYAGTTNGRHRYSVILPHPILPGASVAFPDVKFIKNQSAEVPSILNFDLRIHEVSGFRDFPFDLPRPSS